MRSIAYVGFGANLGDPEETFCKAVQQTDILPGTVVTKVSSLYKTDPVGLIDEGPEFLNAVFEVETQLTAWKFIQCLRRIERSLGKRRDHRSDRSRKIDLDLLLFGKKSFSDNGLEVPHPRMATRAFVLVPLVEIAADVAQPGSKLTLREMLNRLSPEEIEGVRLFKNIRLTKGSLNCTGFS